MHSNGLIVGGGYNGLRSRMERRGEILSFVPKLPYLLPYPGSCSAKPGSSYNHSSVSRPPWTQGHFKVDANNVPPRDCHVLLRLNQVDLFPALLAYSRDEAHEQQILH